MFEYFLIGVPCGIVATLVCLFTEKNLDWGFDEMAGSAVIGLFVAAFWPFVIVWVFFLLVAFLARSLCYLFQSRFLLWALVLVFAGCGGEVRIDSDRSQPQMVVEESPDEMPIEELVRMATLIGNEIVWTGGHKGEVCEKYLGSRVRIGFNVQEDTRIRVGPGQANLNVQRYEIPVNDGRGVAMTVVVSIHLNPGPPLKANSYAEIYGDVDRMEKFGNESFLIDIVTISRSK